MNIREKRMLERNGYIPRKAYVASVGQSLGNTAHLKDRAAWANKPMWKRVWLQLKYWFWI